ncbi:alcohol O-acetyltransferase 2 [Monosporozyma unispora]
MKMAGKDIKQEEVTERLLEETNGIDENLFERGHARRMGHLENYFALLQRQDLYGNFASYCEYDTLINVTRLGPILRKIFFKHPILAHTIIPKNYPNHEEFYLDKAYLEQAYPEHDYIKVLPKLHLNDIIINEQEQYKDKISEILLQFRKDNFEITEQVTEMISQIRIPICHPTKPNWRLLILPEGEGKENFKHIVYISNHCCSDAMNGVNIFKDIADGLSQSVPTASNEDNQLIYDYETDYENFSKIPIPITDRIDYRPGMVAMGKFIGTTMIMNYLTFRFKDSQTDKIKQDTRENFHYNLNITWDQLTKLKPILTKHEASITGFLQACLFITLAEQGIFKDKKWNELGFDMSIPNDNRKNLPSDLVEEQYKYGSNVGGSHYSFLLSSFQRDQLWELSKYYTGVIQNADYNVGLGTIMLDMVYKKQNVDKIISESYLGNKRGGIILSNIGLHEHKGSIGIQDLKFVQDVGALNFALVVNVCSTKVKGMNVCISGVEGTIGDREQFKITCDALKTFIQQYCK